jgi:hypothetical protein
VRKDDVASDGDLLQKRVSWGWGKALQALRKGTPARELDILVINALRNTLRADARAPALGPVVNAIHSVMTDRQQWLGGDLDYTTVFWKELATIEKKYVEFPSTSLVRDACERAACQLLDKVMADLTRDDVEALCCKEVYRSLVGRYGFDPMECKIMKELGLDRNGMERLREDALQAGEPAGIELLRGVVVSKSGRPAMPNEPPIENTAEGLKEELLTAL